MCRHIVAISYETEQAIVCVAAAPPNLMTLIFQFCKMRLKIFWLIMSETRSLVAGNIMSRLLNLQLGRMN
jgi:hypothetical protein